MISKVTLGKRLRQGGAHMGFLKHTVTFLNRTTWIHQTRLFALQAVWLATSFLVPLARRCSFSTSSFRHHTWEVPQSATMGSSLTKTFRGVLAICDWLVSTGGSIGLVCVNTCQFPVCQLINVRCAVILDLSLYKFEWVLLVCGLCW